MSKPGGCVRVLILAVLAPILVGLGVLLISNLSRVITHDTVEGVVVDLLYGVDSDGDPAYTPVYRYVVDGDEYFHRGAVALGGALVPSLGDPKDILYDPANPDDSRVHNVFLLVWLPIILILIPLGIAIVVIWSFRRRSRSQRLNVPRSGQPAGGQPPWSQPSDPASWRPPGAANLTAINATFMGSEPSQMDASGAVRYRIRARAEIDGELVRFVSGWLDEDPTLYYMQHGNQVVVHVSPDDPAVYDVVLPDPD